MAPTPEQVIMSNLTHRLPEASSLCEARIPKQEIFKFGDEAITKHMTNNKPRVWILDTF